MTKTSGLEVFVNSVPGEIRLAVTNCGRLADLVIVRYDELPVLGNIYLGRVKKVLAGLNAAFIDIGQNDSGFLAANDGQILDRHNEKPKLIKALFKEGDAVIVQAIREPSEGKGVKLTTRLDLTGRTVVATQGRPGVAISKNITDEEERARLQTALVSYAHSTTGLIVRTKARGIATEIIQRESKTLIEKISSITAAQKTTPPPTCLYEEADSILKYLRDLGGLDWQRIVVDDRATLIRLSNYLVDYAPELETLFELANNPVTLFETYDLDQQIDDLFDARVVLPSGGGLIIEETAALVAIDVDSCAHNRDSDPELFAVAVNEEAAIEVARQLVLRNLAGQIIIDFLPMKRKKNRDKIQSLLSSALVKTGKCNIFGFSRLGLLEMTRQRNGESLASRFLLKKEATRTVKTITIDLIRAVLREIACNPGRILTVACSHKLYSYLKGDMQVIWNGLLARTGPIVVLEAISTFPENKVEIRTR
jgi:ribonuclease G